MKCYIYVDDKSHVLKNNAIKYCGGGWNDLQVSAWLSLNDDGLMLDMAGNVRVQHH